MNPNERPPLTHEERVELIRTPITFQEFGGMATAGHRSYVAVERNLLRDDGVNEGADAMEQARG